MAMEQFQVKIALRINETNLLLFVLLVITKFLTHAEETPNH